MNQQSQTMREAASDGKELLLWIESLSLSSNRHVLWSRPERKKTNKQNNNGKYLSIMVFPMLVRIHRKMSCSSGRWAVKSYSQLSFMCQQRQQRHNLLLVWSGLWIEPQRWTGPLSLFHTHTQHAVTIYHMRHSRMNLSLRRVSYAANWEWFHNDQRLCLLSE